MGRVVHVVSSWVSSHHHSSPGVLINIDFSVLHCIMVHMSHTHSGWKQLRQCHDITMIGKTFLLLNSIDSAPTNYHTRKILLHMQDLDVMIQIIPYERKLSLAGQGFGSFGSGKATFSSHVPGGETGGEVIQVPL